MEYINIFLEYLNGKWNVEFRIKAFTGHVC